VYPMEYAPRDMNAEWCFGLPCRGPSIRQKVYCCLRCGARGCLLRIERNEQLSMTLVRLVASRP
jgi:hypothetical protein